MKIFKAFFCVAVLCVLTLGLSSCSKDKDEPANGSLVGTWIEDGSSAPFILVLKSDHTGSISYDVDLGRGDVDGQSRANLSVCDYFVWQEDEDSDKNTYLNILHSSGDVIFEDVINRYVKVGNQMKLHVNDTFGFVDFTRQ